MTLTDLGAIGEFIGGIAVIATLIYLARQIRQGAKATQFQTLQAIRGNAMQLRLAAGQSEEVVAIMGKAAEGADLTTTERARFNLMCAAVFDNLAQSYEAAVAGLIGDYAFDPYLRSYLSQEAVRQWWTEGRKLLPPQFVEHIEQHVLPDLEKTRAHWQGSG
jgi:hypothetical protein